VRRGTLLSTIHFLILDVRLFLRSHRLNEVSALFLS